MATTSYGTPYVQSSDLVSGWPTASLNVANRIDAVSYAGNGLNAQTGTTYTLVVGDAGKTVTLNNAASVAVTLPQDSVANVPTGAVVNFYNLGAGTVTISAGAGATLQGGSLTAVQYGYAAVIKLSANTYGPYQPIPVTPGLSLINPSSIANSGGSATNTTGQVVFSTVASVSLNGVFTSTYENYRLVISCKSSNANDYLQLRLRAGGTDNTSNVHNYSIGYVATTATTLTYQTMQSDTNKFRIAYLQTSTYPSYIDLSVGSPQAAEYTRYHGTSNQELQSQFQGGYYKGTTSFDGLTLLTEAGGNALTGTVRVYGYRNS